MVPLTPLPAAGNPGTAASAGGLPVLGAQAMHPADRPAVLVLARPRVVRMGGPASRPSESEATIGGKVITQDTSKQWLMICYARFPTPQLALLSVLARSCARSPSRNL